MPSEPVISIQELARSWALASSQRRLPVSGAIKQALTPAPISTRAPSSAEKPPASENATQPTSATLSRLRITLRGPWRSSQAPIGSCVAEKPRKYPPASKPRSRAFKLNSAVSTGDRVAVMARNSAEKK